MAAHTAPVHRITVFDATDFDVTLAALVVAAPAFGSNFAVATLQGLGGVCMGSRGRLDDGDIDSESVEITPIHEGVRIRPPGALTNTGYITRQAGIDEIKWVTYDIGQDIFGLDSNVAEDGVSSQRTATQTNRAVLVERDGICAEAYPQVTLHVSGHPGGFGPGDDAVSKLEFLGIVQGTTEIPSGQTILYYEVAGT